MSPVAAVAARVLAEHRVIDDIDECGVWRRYACTCGWLPETSRDSEGGHASHVATEIAAALRADEGLIEAIAEAMIRAGGWKDEPVTQGDRRVARAALDAVTGSET